MDERLEKIKKLFENQKGSAKIIGVSDAHYLIQQAEKAQESEEEVERTENSFANAYMQYQKQYERVRELEQQNQRYKEALEYAESELEYAHVTGNMELRGSLIKDSIKGIKKALRGEST